MVLIVFNHILPGTEYTVICGIHMFTYRWRRRRPPKTHVIDHFFRPELRSVQWIYVAPQFQSAVAISMRQPCSYKALPLSCSAARRSAYETGAKCAPPPESRVVMQTAFPAFICGETTTNKNGKIGLATRD